MDNVDWVFRGRLVRTLYQSRVDVTDRGTIRRGHFEMMKKGHLRLHQIRRKDAGIYECRERTRTRSSTPGVRRCIAFRLIIVGKWRGIIKF